MDQTQIDDAVEQLHTARDWIRWAASRFVEAEVFFGHGTDNAFDEATALVLPALHLTYDVHPDYLNTRLTATERRLIAAWIEERIDKRTPVSYLTHEAWFAGLPFYVDERVLVPRSPIAELISEHFEPWLVAEDVGRALDMCTGSACIGIATAYALPNALVDVADVSTEALEVAAINVERHGLQDQLRVVHSDLFCALAGERYDLIVSNPPYVDADEIAAMPEEFRAEPELGLASGADGLDLTRRMLAEAADHLTDTGVLIVEVGASAPALTALFPDVPFMWLDFENGGDGVFLLTADQVREYTPLFKSTLT